MSDKEYSDFEKYVRTPFFDLVALADRVRATQCKSQQEKAPGRAKQAKEDLAAWDKQLQTLKRLLPVEVAYNKVVSEDIPMAEKTAEAHAAKLPAASQKSQEVRSTPSLPVIVS
jgi:hypothetical protein